VLLSLYCSENWFRSGKRGRNELSGSHSLTVRTLVSTNQADPLSLSFFLPLILSPSLSPSCPQSHPSIHLSVLVIHLILFPLCLFTLQLSHNPQTPLTSLSLTLQTTHINTHSPLSLSSCHLPAHPWYNISPLYVSLSLTLQLTHMYNP
jgi:hypothetical protein